MSSLMETEDLSNTIVELTDIMEIRCQKLIVPTAIRYNDHAE